MDKKWLLAIVTSLIVLPMMVFSRDRIQKVWAYPDKVDVVAKEVDEQKHVQKELSALYVEQQHRMDTQEKLDELREANLKEQLQLIAEIKKGKK